MGQWHNITAWEREVTQKFYRYLSISYRQIQDSKAFQENPEVTAMLHQLTLTTEAATAEEIAVFLQAMPVAVIATVRDFLREAGIPPDS